MSGGFASNKKIEALLNKYLPENFEDLKHPFYAGCVDTNSAEYKLFNN
jgi:predicted acylesterase/phospholipase RssA